ncbi:hypothetical protein ACIHEI_29805 [Kitasatospora sp. NPDC051984]|uniref:hypothetical protein n=1 Tax=Kitasatospora sp. NPDC051984 TaxID=3364059 RepID=UPI0037CB2BC2
MRMAGRAVWNSALAALIWAAVFFGLRGLAEYSYQQHLQAIVPTLVIIAMWIAFIAWVGSRDDPTGWLVIVAVLGTIMLVGHMHLLDVRALRDHGIEQHARVTRVTTEWDANNNSHQRYTLEALDGPPITATIDGGYGDYYDVGDTVTVTTDPTGHVGPQLGTTPSTGDERWTARIDTATAVLMGAPLTAWAVERTRKRRSPDRS